ncbi:GDP-fucose protein O-fucosyltransferase 1-like [Lytechinus variegatus]|uniref:GDP-fucose protein O-fucosyltransferase 1-like n=1 Tax=Lytechinus variegatus TaxID=7654 RepID=UPI001BB0F7F3|nr:GDP-fucose protein O-fucosyltransferase 1-like [Lytechinus variegatus]XP_041481468.1 GDP-fucose protein O-fucosyltransferase 1-like [Lytechinus variegatus]
MVVDSANRKSSVMLWSLYLMVLFSHVCGSDIRNVDPNGYVVYCPCMGRFGNQADHFLGALSFAHGLDRTLILPPWNDYGKPSRAAQIPFDKYFKVDPLREYHRVITMETFMKELAPSLWPKEKRTGFCYRFRDGTDCKMKEGNPFGPFWDNHHIDFFEYKEYGPLSYNTHLPNARNMWEAKFPVSEYPVIALSGAPAAFPVTQENRQLHKYLHWSEEIDGQADQFIQENLSGSPFVGVHMRQGSDWVNACRHVKDAKQLFASPQCLGYQQEFGSLTDDLCMPSFDLVKEQIKAVVKKIKAEGVFIASDVEPDVKSLKKFLPSKVKIVQHKPSNPQVDLAILGKSDHYICNCVSSFSAFAKRERDATGKPSSFWGFGEDYERIKKRRSQKSRSEL